MIRHYFYKDKYGEDMPYWFAIGGFTFNDKRRCEYGIYFYFKVFGYMFWIERIVKTPQGKETHKPRG